MRLPLALILGKKGLSQIFKPCSETSSIHTMNPPQTPASVFVVVGPAGSGKTSLCDELNAKHGFARCRTATTRPPRPDEVNGVHYDFCRTEEEFFALDLLEKEEVHGRGWYGTPRKNLFELAQKGGTIILSIDLDGLITLKSLAREKLGGIQIFSIFVDVPPCRECTLKGRLLKRKGGIAPDELARRIATAHYEFSRMSVCDHIVVNREGGLSLTVDDALKFIRNRTKR